LKDNDTVGGLLNYYCQLFALFWVVTLPIAWVGNEGWGAAPSGAGPTSARQTPGQWRGARLNIDSMKQRGAKPVGEAGEHSPIILACHSGRWSDMLIGRE